MASPIRPKLKVWVTFGDRLKFGDGRAQLLELIAERGSLRKAAAELGMSYRNAWGYLRELEEAAGFAFLERVPGGGPSSGMRLTDDAKRFLKRYRQFRTALEADVERRFEQSYAGGAPPGAAPTARPSAARAPGKARASRG